MKHVGPATISAFPDRILNIHPALLPKYGGPGMYGMHVHRAVIAGNESVSGVTVHLVTGEYDAGPIIAQRRVPVYPDDTPETLQQRVLTEEHRIYGDVLSAIERGSLLIERGQPSTIIG
jgi:phosphoribosylglycinamide formyltransferase 1